MGGWGVVNGPTRREGSGMGARGERGMCRAGMSLKDKPIKAWGIKTRSAQRER